MYVIDFDLLFKRYWHPLRIHALKFLREESDAENVASDTFLSLYDSTARFKNHTALNAWLYTTARNKAINVALWNKSRRYFQIDDLDENHLILEDDERERSLLECKILKEIKNEIERMPPKQKQIMEMYLFKRMSQETISKKLGLAKPTINQQLYLAKTRIKDFIHKKMSYLEIETQDELMN